MNKEVVIGIDLGVKRSISTSAFRNYGDETMYNAVTEHWDEANSWIAEWIVRLTAKLNSYVRNNGVNIIAMEELNILKMNISENMKEYLTALKNEIEKVAQENRIIIKHVNPRSTSKICSNCGKLGYRQRREFTCSYCGFTEDADINAAKNIGLRYIITAANEDNRKDRNPFGKYYLATSYGPKPFEDYEWVKKIIEA
jgi:ribosomal protein L37E